MNNTKEEKKKIENNRETVFIYYFFKKFQNVYELNFELEKLENAICDNENELIRKIVSSILRKGLNKQRIKNWNEDLKLLIEERIKDNKFYTNINPMTNGSFFNLSVFDKVKTLKNICKWAYSIENDENLTLKMLLKGYLIEKDAKGNQYYKSGTYSLLKISNNKIIKISKSKDNLIEIITRLKKENENLLINKLEEEFNLKRKRKENNKKYEGESESETKEENLVIISDSESENEKLIKRLKKGKGKAKEEDSENDTYHENNNSENYVFLVKINGINRIKNKSEEETKKLINNIVNNDNIFSSYFNLDNNKDKDFINALKRLFSKIYY